MAELVLDVCDIPAGVHEMGGDRMPEHVRWRRSAASLARSA